MDKANRSELLAALREIDEALTPGPWGVRYFVDDHDGESRRFRTALALSLEHDAYAGRTCWRLIAGGPDACNGDLADDEAKDDDWLNLGFFGNGPCSGLNVVALATLRDLLPQLVELLTEL